MTMTQDWKITFYTDGSSEADALMPEVIMLFFYTMAFRWHPCVKFLFPKKSNYKLVFKVIY